MVGAIGCQAVDNYNNQFEQKCNLSGRSIPTHGAGGGDSRSSY